MRNLLLLPLLLVLAACGGTSAGVPTNPAPLTPNPVANALTGRLTYLREGQIWFIDLDKGAVPVAPRPLTTPETGQVLDYAWSVDAENIIFLAAQPSGEVRLMVTDFLAAVPPQTVDTNASYPAWSPNVMRVTYLKDGQVWASGTFPAEPQALTNQPDWTFSNPVFTADGQGVIVAGAPRAQATNATFRFEVVRLDGTRAPVPGPEFTGQIPADVRLSPDGRWLAFTNSWQVNACATDSYTQLLDVTTGATREVRSSLLAAHAGAERYATTHGFVWHPLSASLMVHSQITDCADPANPRLVAGPQLAWVDISADPPAERALIPGEVFQPAFYISGQFVAATRLLDPASNATLIEVYDTASGAKVLDVGPGYAPAFRPKLPVRR